MYSRRVIPIVIISILISQTRIPEYEIHNRGNLWDTMNDDGTHGAHPNRLGEYNPSMDWPGGPTNMGGPFDQRSYLYKAGVWTGGLIEGSVFLSKNGPDEFDIGIFDKIEKELNYIEMPSYDHTKAEEIITASWITSKNISIKRTSRSWSFRGYNDFIIITYEITNLNGKTINDFYFGNVFLLRPSLQDHNNHNGWNDALSRADDVIGISTSDKMIYAHDGTGAFDYSAGVGNWRDGNLLTPGFAGFAALDAPVASNGLEQPGHYFLSNYIMHKSALQLSNNTEQSLYNILSGSDLSLAYAQGDTIDLFALMSFGPYLFENQQTISISIVEAVNGLDYRDVINLDGTEMNNIQNRYVNEGLDSLLLSVGNARSLFNNNYIFDDYPPPSPPRFDLIASPAEQSIKLVWEPIEKDWINPRTGRKNIEKYIIYRTDKEFIGPYDVIKNRIRVHKTFDLNAYYNSNTNKWQYNDSDISLGVSYYYSITSVDSSGRESWFTNRNEVPLQAVSEPKKNTLSVNVFPNPFSITSGIPTLGQENTITWTNLPSPCTISIFTASGQLIKKIDHNDDIGDATWDQRTSSRLITSPGIYFWGVESAVGNATGTLLIIK
ncbi:MAG: hypothetical protein CMG74_12160 [Candidatus Marinimicrobia bacterium]|nr:hypothetical protein [Candidatus Neomarinimicrobiota bacterium]|tara:strand:- start:19098 stop:20918 length:1821 start_codon:yes stop_codon:yes gene_type:complete